MTAGTAGTAGTALRRGCPLALAILLAACAGAPGGADADGRPPGRAVFEVVFTPAARAQPFSGRALVFLSRVEPEPRTWNNPARLEPVLAADFEGVPPRAPMRIDSANRLCFPATPEELEGGAYFVQAVLDADPGAPWPGSAPGNPCSQARRVELGGGRAPVVRLVCDRTIAASAPPETPYVRSVEVESARLSAFHGRPTRLRALVHLPEAWLAEPERRFPLLIVVSGFGASLAGFQSVDWPSPPLDGEPFVTVYPDPSCVHGHSAFLNSDNNGPWADALVEELLPVVEERFRCVDDREARLLAGHSSGAWSVLWLMARHPARFGAAWASSPDPVDFRDFMGVDLYAPDANLLYDPAGRPRPFCTLGGWTVNYTFEHARREEVLRGGVLGFFEALLGGRGADGEPQRLFDRATGAVDPAVVERWRRHDLSLYLREHWDELGPLLDGRIVLTVGDKDNFLLHGSVELLRRELEALGAHIDVHVLSGDHFSELQGPSSADVSRRMVERFRTWRLRSG